MTDLKSKKDSKRLLLQYAGLATQLMVSLAFGILIGNWLDKKMNIHVPVFTWILPLAILVLTFIKVIKDTSNK